MKNITNIDEILIRYYKACIGQDEIIKEFAKGDWSKAESRTGSSLHYSIGNIQK